KGREGAIGSQLEDRPRTVGAAGSRSAVKVATAILHQAGKGRSAVRIGKREQRGEGAGGRYFEDGAPAAIGSTILSGAIETAIGALHESRGRIRPLLVVEGVDG